MQQITDKMQSLKKQAIDWSQGERTHCAAAQGGEPPVASDPDRRHRGMGSDHQPPGARRLGALPTCVRSSSRRCPRSLVRAPSGVQLIASALVRRRLCYQQNIQVTSIHCPFCKMRIGTWNRKAKDINKCKYE